MAKTIDLRVAPDEVLNIESPCKIRVLDIVMDRSRGPRCKLRLEYQDNETLANEPDNRIGSPPAHQEG